MLETPRHFISLSDTAILPSLSLIAGKRLQNTAIFRTTESQRKNKQIIKTDLLAY